MTKQEWTPTVNDLSYYPLLHKAILETKGAVIECGTGHGSTPHLHDECKGRQLVSFETSQEWLNKFTQFESKNHKLFLISNWREVYQNHPDADVIFVDHAPGEDRKLMIADYKNTKGIIVVHDTELGQADHGYRTRATFPQFKYVVEVRTDGAWANAMSNDIDITKWIGEEYGDFKITAYDPTLKSDRIDD